MKYKTPNECPNSMYWRHMAYFCKSKEDCEHKEEGDIGTICTMSIIPKEAKRLGKILNEVENWDIDKYSENGI